MRSRNHCWLAGDRADASGSRAGTGLMLFSRDEGFDEEDSRRIGACRPYLGGVRALVGLLDERYRTPNTEIP